MPVLTSILAIPQCAGTPGSLPREIDTSDTHFSDLTCPQGCLRVPFSPLQPKTFSGASRWKSMRLSVIINVHAGGSDKCRVDSLPLRHAVWVGEESGCIIARIAQ